MTASEATSRALSWHRSERRPISGTRSSSRLPATRDTGGLSQAATGTESRSVVSFTIDGRQAIYTPAGQGHRAQPWADLVAIRQHDLAVRVTARRATRSRLVEILRRVRPAEHHDHAPTVPNPPRGLRVVGSVDADMVTAMKADIREGQVPGPPDSHTASWINGRDRLTVMTLPGTAADIAAMVGVARFFPGAPAVVHHERVNARDAVELDLSSTLENGNALRVLLTVTAWGELLAVVAQGSPRSVPSMIQIAESVRPVDNRTWQHLVTRAHTN